MQGFSDNELEQMLRSVPLHKPSAALDTRVLDEIHGSAVETAGPASVKATSPATTLVPAPYRLGWRVGSALAACIAIAALVLLAINHGEPGSNNKSLAGDPGATAEMEFNPIRIEEVWSAVQPQGVVHVDDTPLRRYVQQTYERVQLIDDARNIHIEYTQPRHDLIVTPARFD